MPSRPRIGSIYQRGGRWWIQYRHDGKTIRESSKSELKGDAESLLKQRLAQIMFGAFGGPSLERTKIGELLDDLERDYKTNGKAWKAFADPIVRGHLRPRFGHLRAAKLTTADVQNYISERRSQRAANATINRECSLLKRAFSLGLKQTPPKVSRIPTIPRLDENNVRKGYMEYADFVALRQALPEELRAVLTFAFYTGCRRGEILSLRWAQVDLASRIVRLEPGATKNDHARELPLSPEPYEMLAMQKTIRDTFYRECPWVFFRKGKPITEFRGAWNRACKDAGLVDDDGVPTRIFHDLRRSGIRNLIRAGISQNVAMKISGHRTDSVFRRYDIVTQQDLHDAARQLGLYVEEAQAKLKESISTELAQSGPTSGSTQSVDSAKLLRN